MYRCNYCNNSLGEEPPNRIVLAHLVYNCEEIPTRSRKRLDWRTRTCAESNKQEGEENQTIRVNASNDTYELTTIFQLPDGREVKIWENENNRKMVKNDRGRFVHESVATALEKASEQSNTIDKATSL